MATSGDVTIASDGGNAKLHPYLVALVPRAKMWSRINKLAQKMPIHSNFKETQVKYEPGNTDAGREFHSLAVRNIKDEEKRSVRIRGISTRRWCVSCLWSTATVLLHRLITGPLPAVTGSSSKSRPAGREHLHPEPKVDCEVLHQPAVHNLDVIFVHGLYGSLGNTWRQGEWRTKYIKEPEIVHLRRPKATPTPCLCLQCNEQNKNNSNNNNKDNFNNIRYDNKNDFNNLSCDSKNDFNKLSDSKNQEKIINYEAFTNIDERFYKNITKILPKDDTFTTERFYNNTLINQIEIIDNYETQAKFVSDLFKNCDNICDGSKTEFAYKNKEQIRDEINKINAENNCKCVKECETGCGCVCDDCYSPCWPRDWIKVDYPDARVISINYTSDPHLWRPLWIKENKRLRLHERAEQMVQQLLDLGVGSRPVVWVGHSKGGLFIKQIYCEAYEAYLKSNPECKEQTENKENLGNNNKSIIFEKTNNNGANRNNNFPNADGSLKNENNNVENANNNMEKQNSNFENDNNNKDGNNGVNENPTEVKVDENNWRDDTVKFSNTNEDQPLRQSSLWSNSIAFMFYSVPHRGSPLADIKTPITARSVELMEISKDNSLVLSLQERWLHATSTSKPLVRSLVETRRTLMSVLWLRIVSADSADPGIGALCGVSVDHREICKPSSRKCLLYTELAALITTALNKRKNVKTL